MKYWKKFWPLYLIVGCMMILAAIGTDRAVSTIAENTPIERKQIIVIDAGHGGLDGGATSCSGVLESQINLEIALRLEDLCHLMGYATRMIRTTDISVYTEGNSIAEKKASDLRQRVRIINETENGILISIHQNTFSDSRYSGAQVFYASTSGSQELAKILQNNFIMSLNPDSHRQEKPADHVYIMKHIQTPGVLVECGFLSNPEEEAKLRSAAYQKNICCIILSSLSAYLHA